jgi:hypothetical protein
MPTDYAWEELLPGDYELLVALEQRGFTTGEIAERFGLSRYALKRRHLRLQLYRGERRKCANFDVCGEYLQREAYRHSRLCSKGCGQAVRRRARREAGL